MLEDAIFLLQSPQEHGHDDEAAHYDSVELREDSHLLSHSSNVFIFEASSNQALIRLWDVFL